jgi:hypothetical protein
LRAVEDANKINQDNTTLIVIDIKEREVRYEAEPAAVIAAPAEPVSRVADVEIPEEPREPRSYKWLVWLIVLGLFGGGGYFAWQQGIIDDAMEKGTDLVESTTQTIEAELEAEPEPTRAGDRTHLRRQARRFQRSPQVRWLRSDHDQGACGYLPHGRGIVDCRY